MERTALAGHTVVVPEIIDYEIRRELIRARKTSGPRRLDELVSGLHYEPLTRARTRIAAQFWADARMGGRQAARDDALDIDMILAAQAHHMASGDNEAIIATTNVRHLVQFSDARLWDEIA